ncbi:MAG: hypothetical protein KNU04_gp24 [crAssphage sp. isolate ctbg_1]|uniref:Uncharacterized protein n=1 Tax=crAssphage sp. isolate ctbg_1 TaxID=2989854 RepID=A0A345MSZ3_9CAUD|nr:MAG: hypothetical protein KNU04_gp24 [crAssphage sp. isolate ctbg_1]AXH74493.1 MAG: hypothetical protein [crAssphage sp. isolate ctbg_1]
MATKQLYDLNDNPIYPKVECIDNLNSTDATTPLSAKQGKVLKDLINNSGGGNANVEDIIYIFPLPSTDDSDNITETVYNELIEAINSNKIILIDYDYLTATAAQVKVDEGNIDMVFSYNNSIYRFNVDINNYNSTYKTYAYTCTTLSSLIGANVFGINIDFDTRTISTTVVDNIKANKHKRLYIDVGEERCFITNFIDESIISFDFYWLNDFYSVKIDTDNLVNSTTYRYELIRKPYIKVFPFSENGGCPEVLDYLNTAKVWLNDGSYLNNVLLLGDNGDCKYTFPISNVIITNNEITGVWGTANIGDNSYKITVTETSTDTELFYINNGHNLIIIDDSNYAIAANSGMPFLTQDYLIGRVKLGIPTNIYFTLNGIVITPTYLHYEVDNDMDSVKGECYHPDYGIIKFNITGNYLIINEIIKDIVINAVAGGITTEFCDSIKFAFENKQPIYIGYENDKSYSVPICLIDKYDEDAAKCVDIIYFDKDTYQRKCVRVNLRDEKITLPNI